MCFEPLKCPRYCSLWILILKKKIEYSLMWQILILKMCQSSKSLLNMQKYIILILFSASKPHWMQQQRAMVENASSYGEKYAREKKIFQSATFFPHANNFQLVLSLFNSFPFILRCDIFIPSFIPFVRSYHLKMCLLS